MDRTAASPLVGEASRYLEDTAPNNGGRNTRPLAIPVVVTTYVSGSRTGAGVGVAVLGALAGLAAWFGVEELTAESSLVLAIVAFVLAAGLLAAAVVLAIRLVRSGVRLVEALRRWYQVAPEVPVRGVEVLTQQAGIVRIVLSGLAVVTAIAIVVVAGATGESSVWVAAGFAVPALLGVGAAGALGWWRVRSLLAATAPQPSGDAFAPAPYAQQPAMQPAQSHPYQQGHQAPPHQQQPPPQQWAPPPPQPQPQPQPQPWLPAGAQPGGETWTSAPELASELGDTRLVTDGTTSGPARFPVVVLDDGRRLTSGVTTLVGRAPTPRENDLAVEIVPVLHPTVSKTHAAFRVTDEAVYVTDRSSTNGTTAVGQDGAQRRVKPWAEVQVETGGAVLLGSYRISVVASEDLER
ncbi:FHA domain-containing protein [Pseudactinotalea terrae]|uniref:FHA domain-containing protein n=1 Tax=Pseudactinotalea terrae TaxID=1743262 RepID=UPI0012E1E825|nr:FHA domain-containing protein [Pseudactinotalea terrae]